MKDSKMAFYTTADNKAKIEAEAKENNMKTGHYLRSIVERHIQSNELLKNRAEEYVLLVTDIDSITNDIERKNVRKRLEAFLCL